MTGLRRPDFRENAARSRTMSRMAMAEIIDGKAVADGVVQRSRP